MFSNIEDLEKQVNEFCDNMLASDKLVKGIEELTDSISSHKEAFATDTQTVLSQLSDLKDKLKKTVDSIKSNCETLLASLNAEISDCINGLNTTSSDNIEKLTKANDILINKAVQDFNDKQQEYIVGAEAACREIKNAETEIKSVVSRLNEAENKLDNSTAELYNKIEKLINDFSEENKKTSNQTIDAVRSNINELSGTIEKSIKSESDGIKKSINVKFIIAMAAAGIAIALSAAAILL